MDDDSNKQFFSNEGMIRIVRSVCTPQCASGYVESAGGLWHRIRVSVNRLSVNGGDFCCPLQIKILWRYPWLS